MGGERVGGDFGFGFEVFSMCLAILGFVAFS
jgi:hypothetical protein